MILFLRGAPIKNEKYQIHKLSCILTDFEIIKTYEFLNLQKEKKKILKIFPSAGWILN